MTARNLRATFSLRAWVVLSALLIVALIIIGLSYYQAERTRIQLEKHDEIASVVELKVREIGQWRLECLADVRVLSRGSFTKKAILESIRTPSNMQLRKAVQERLMLERRLELYSDAFVLDTTGRVIISTGVALPDLDTADVVSFHQAVSEHQPVSTDLFRRADGKIVIDVMNAVLDQSGKPFAVIVLRSDADDFLYPFVYSWPIRTRSAETLLLEKQGNDVLILNDLRFHPGGPLSLRIPLTYTASPAVQAALGRVGMFEGKSYRGKKVLADLRPIPNTPWSLVAEVDAGEILAEADYRGGVVIVVVVLFMALAVVATAYAYRRRQARIYRDLYQAERERQQTEQEFKTTLYSIGDGVITTDTRGFVKQMNPVAEQLTGWKESEARGKVLEEVFRILNEESRSSVENPVVRVLREGQIVGLANHTVLISKVGTEYPIADSGAPIRDESGNVTGVVLIFRDQTKEREVLEALRESEARLKKAQAIANLGFLDWDLKTGQIVLSEEAYRIFGIERKGEISTSELVQLVVYPADLEYVRDNLQKAIKGEGRYNIDHRILRPDGSIVWVNAQAELIKDSHGNPETLLGTILDISERKRVELSLVNSETKYRNLVEMSPDGIAIHQDGKIVFVNPAGAKILGASDPTEVVGKPIDEIIHPDHLAAAKDRIARFQSGETELYPIEDLYVKFDGTPVPVEVMAVPLTHNGRPASQVVVRDITDRKRAQEEAMESEERFRMVFEHVFDGICIYREEPDLDKRKLIECNERYAAMAGRSREELLKLESTLALQKTLDEAANTRRLESLAKGKPYQGVYSWIRPDGKENIIEYVGVPIKWRGKSLSIGIDRDITQRKHAERTLRESRQMLRTVLDTVPVRVFWKDRDGRYTGCNKSFAEGSGFNSPEDIIGKDDSQMSWHEQAELYCADDREVMESGVPKLSYEEPQTCVEGIRWLRTSKVPLKNIAGEVIGVLGSSEDITERKLSEEALRESEEKFRALVEGSHSAIWIHDGKRFLHANPATFEMMGYSADELYKLTPEEFVHPDSRELAAMRIEERIKGKNVAKHYEYQMVKKSGEAIWVDLTGARIEYRGKPAIIISAYDVTDRRKIEEQLVQAQKMEGVGRLAGGVAHDYNNMLSVIIGYSDLIMKKMEKADPVYRYVEFIASAAKRAADITRQLLAFARREIVSPRVLNPNEAIESLRKMLQRLIGENIRLMFRPDKHLWNVRIDATQFDQIIVNLATNARDAIDDVGTIIIETSNASVDEAYAQNRIDFLPGEYAVIGFSDTGKGMDKETMEKIFEPFFTTKSKGQGTGLGLSTVYGVVRQNAGSINVYSETGLGTTFKIYLPRHQGEVEKLDEAQEQESIGGTETVLVVEDQSDLLELAKHSLQEYGYEVVTALSPGEAILLCESYEDEIHVLLTDVIMPMMNGKELCRRIQAMKPRIKSIFMSGYTANVIAHQGVLDEGMDFIQKPFTPYGLAKKVREVLDS